MNRWIVNTDGGCPNNPGPGAFAFVIYKGAEKVCRSGFLPMVTTTNNQAEYRALTAALLFLADQSDLPAVVEIWSDSEVMVRQMSGAYKVNAPLRPFYDDAVAALKVLKRRTEVYISHFKREHNVEADDLCNLVLERRGIEIVSKKKKSALLTTRNATGGGSLPE